ncbi:MAG: hypothetical protein LKJ69_04825 [Lactobacillus sp.]|jgi:hypothetical protein|nr:hypothetical protein [Lactobacillus sp.]MCI2032707.1 hypothetical protein [Lactobacillus sp.]
MKLHCYKLVDVYGDFYMVRNTVLFDVLQYFLIARMFGGPAKAYRLTDKGIKTLAPSRSIMIPTKPGKRKKVGSSAAGGSGVLIASRLSAINGPVVESATAILSFRIIIMVYVGWLILMYWRAQVEYRNLIAQHLIETDVAPRAVKRQIRGIRVSEAVQKGADNGYKPFGVFMSHLGLDLLYFGMLIGIWFVFFVTRPTLAVYLFMIVCMILMISMRWAFTALTKHPIRI